MFLTTKTLPLKKRVTVALSLWAYSRKLPGPHKSFIRAVLTDTVSVWAKDYGNALMTTPILLGEYGPQLAHFVRSSHIPHLENTAILSEFVNRGLLENAIFRKSPALLKSLTFSDTVLLKTHFTIAMAKCLRPNLPNPKAVSLFLATLADSKLSQERWKNYADGLVGAACNGHIGVFSWANSVDLPVLECLPLQEAITKAYGSIPTDEAFLLMLAISNAHSGHSVLKMKKFLTQAGQTPEIQLFTPDSKFIDACKMLPGITPSQAAS
jgi:hypothetical protein